jgi:hypothetical protein
VYDTSFIFDAPNEFQNVITTLMTHYPFNGNVLPLKSQPQDGVCTTGPLANSMNSNPLILSCCKAHDACYTQNKCNASSFLPVGPPGACSICNAKVAACIVNALPPIPIIW